MIVKLSTDNGFCGGIKRAIAIAESNPGAVVIGDIIHNPQEIARLARDFNVTTQDDISCLVAGQTVIVRPHGIAKQIEQTLCDRGVNLIDATCPKVKAIHHKVQELDAQGYRIILLGDANHAEVKGIVSYATCPVIVVKNKSELPEMPDRKIALLSQTTKDERDLLEIHAHLPQAELHNTICPATAEKHKATLDLARQVDILIVVGGRHSSNTNLLLEIAKPYCDAYLVENSSQIDLKWFTDKKVCGLTSGSSTPDYSLQEVKERLEAI